MPKDISEVPAEWVEVVELAVRADAAAYIRSLKAHAEGQESVLNLLESTAAVVEHHRSTRHAAE